MSVIILSDSEEFTNLLDFSIPEFYTNMRFKNYDTENMNEPLMISEKTFV